MHLVVGGRFELGDDLGQVDTDRGDAGGQARLIDRHGFEARPHVVKTEVDRHETRTRLGLEEGEGFSELGRWRGVAGVGLGGVEHLLGGVARAADLGQVKGDAHQGLAVDEVVGVALVGALAVVAVHAGGLKADGGGCPHVEVERGEVA